MIHITDKSHCCGCSSCVSVCPKQCIKMVKDEEGFLYPETDTSFCIKCKLCENVCPELCQKEERTPISVYAIKNKNEQIRLVSSSGGIFTLLAEKVINEGGVVFGARFNAEWDVVHDYTETKEGISAFRGSKYVQSRMGNCYQKVKSFLQCRKVMFTGTPCQIAGLRNYLGKDYDNLLTVDVVCHGVPSPKVWQMYLNETIHKSEKNLFLSHSISKRDVLIKNISFRDKCSGWKKYSFTLILSEMTTGGGKGRNSVSLSSIFSKNPYMNAFLLDLSLRPSCYSCPAKEGKSGSDVSIADFWGIENVLPDFDDDKGVSLVLSYSEKGESWLNSLDYEYREVSYQTAKQENPSMVFSVVKPVNRNFFFHQLKSGKSIQQICDNCTSTALNKRINRFLYRKFNL